MSYSKETEKEIYFAKTVIGAIDNVEMPRLVYEEEKQVVKKALRKYIDELETQARFGYGNR